RWRARGGRVPGPRRRRARLGRGGSRRTRAPPGRDATSEPLGGRERADRVAPRPLGGAADPLARPGGGVLALGPEPPGAAPRLGERRGPDPTGEPETGRRSAGRAGRARRRAGDRRAPRAAGSLERCGRARANAPAAPPATRATRT